LVSLRPILPLIGLIIVWGLSMPVIKLGLRDFPPLACPVGVRCRHGQMAIWLAQEGSPVLEYLN